MNLKIISHVYFHFNRQLSGIPTPLNVGVRKEASVLNPLEKHDASSSLLSGDAQVMKTLVSLISSLTNNAVNESVRHKHAYAHTHVKIMKNISNTHTYIHIYTQPRKKDQSIG